LSAHWTWWAGGLALAGVMLLNWLVVRRLMAVSGRFTALIDRLRFGAPEDPGMTEEELVEAIRAATADAFGAGAIETESAPEEPPTELIPMPQRKPVHHVIFLVSVLAGGALSAILAGTFAVTAGLRSESFTSIFGASSTTLPLVLVAGGMLVGFGTRMAAGCTSGHGLCGVSRGQPGSILATASFFGMGIVVSLLLGLLT
jgi:uncharacterized protein